jgi:hypothetical protein
MTIAMLLSNTVASAERAIRPDLGEGHSRG